MYDSNLVDFFSFHFSEKSLLSSDLLYSIITVLHKAINNNGAKDMISHAVYSYTGSSKETYKIGAL